MKPENTGRKIKMTVATRQQAPEEERQFIAAMELFLTELFRQQLHREGEENEKSEIKG